jgi:hypothetical protein
VLQKDLGYYVGRGGAHCNSVILHNYVFVKGKIVVPGDDLVPI